MTTPNLSTAPLGAFDIDAWLDGAAPPERSVVVYGRADLVAEYEALDDELGTVRGDVSTSVMMNGAAAGRAREIADRMTEIRETLQASKLVVRVKALPRDVVADLLAGQKQVPEDQQDDWLAEQWVAAAAIRPAMTVEQVKRFRDRVGEGQFVKVWQEAYATTNEKTVSVPFSLRHSATLATPGT